MDRSAPDQSAAATKQLVRLRGLPAVVLEVLCRPAAEMAPQPPITVYQAPPSDPDDPYPGLRSWGPGEGPGATCATMPPGHPIP